MKSAYDEAVRLLPSKTAAALGERFKTAEEFRLRAGRYPCALIGGREEAIADRAVLAMISPVCLKKRQMHRFMPSGRTCPRAL